MRSAAKIFFHLRLRFRENRVSSCLLNNFISFQLKNIHVWILFGDLSDAVDDRVWIQVFERWVEWRLLSEETLKNTTFVQLVIKRICFFPASKGNLLYFYFSLFFFSNIIIIFLSKYLRAEYEGARWVYATCNMSMMLPLMMMVEDYIHSIARITIDGIIVKNRWDVFAVFVGIMKNVLQVRGVGNL